MREQCVGSTKQIIMILFVSYVGAEKIRCELQLGRWIARTSNAYCNYERTRDYEFLRLRKTRSFNTGFAG